MHNKRRIAQIFSPQQNAIIMYNSQDSHHYKIKSTKTKKKNKGKTKLIRMTRKGKLKLALNQCMHSHLNMCFPHPTNAIHIEEWERKRKEKKIKEHM